MSVTLHRTAYVSIWAKGDDGRWNWVETCALVHAARICRRDPSVAAFDPKDDPNSNALAWRR